MTIQTLPVFDAGDTLNLGVLLLLPVGNWTTATCQIRDAYTHALIGTAGATLGVALTAGDPASIGWTPVTLSAASVDTALWLVGNHMLDLRLTDSTGVIAHTSPLIFPIVNPITLPT